MSKREKEKMNITKDNEEEIKNKNELQKAVNELISELEITYADEEEIKKLKYLSDEFWKEIEEKRFEAIEEVDILSEENDKSARNELEDLRHEIRGYDVMFQNKSILVRVGYETYLKYKNREEMIE